MVPGQLLVEQQLQQGWVGLLPQLASRGGRSMELVTMFFAIFRLQRYSRLPRARDGLTLQIIP